MQIGKQGSARVSSGPLLWGAAERCPTSSPVGSPALFIGGRASFSHCLSEDSRLLPAASSLSGEADGAEQARWAQPLPILPVVEVLLRAVSTARLTCVQCLWWFVLFA